MTPKLITVAKESNGDRGSALTKKWSGRNRDFLGWSFHTQHLAFLKVQLCGLPRRSCSFPGAALAHLPLLLNWEVVQSEKEVDERQTQRNLEQGDLEQARALSHTHTSIPAATCIFLSKHQVRQEHVAGPRSAPSLPAR